jgi:hypothetical protein
MRDNMTNSGSNIQLRKTDRIKNENTDQVSQGETGEVKWLVVIKSSVEKTLMPTCIPSPGAHIYSLTLLTILTKHRILI